MKVIAVPKTMDNDVRNTEYCIGFSTAITRAMDAIERQRTTVGSHERIGVFRVFGRDAGYTALYTAYVTSLRCCIPEYKVNLQHLIELLITDKKNNPSNYSLVILSEGAEWEGYQVKEYGEAGRVWASQEDERGGGPERAKSRAATGEETIVSDLTYDLRSGSPDFVDQLVAIDLRGHGHGRHPGGQARPDDGASRAGATPWRRFPIRSWARARWTWPPCTTPSVTGRLTTTSSVCRSS